MSKGLSSCGFELGIGCPTLPCVGTSAEVLQEFCDVALELLLFIVGPVAPNEMEAKLDGLLELGEVHAVPAVDGSGTNQASLYLVPALRDTQSTSHHSCAIPRLCVAQHKPCPLEIIRFGSVRRKVWLKAQPCCCLCLEMICGERV